MSAVVVQPDAALDAERRSGIGGTDVAAIAGVHPWKTAHQVWLEKMALADPVTSEAAYWGTVLEPIIGREYGLRRGVEIYRPEPRFVAHPQRVWMIGHPDYLVAGESTGLDCKTTSLRLAARWGEQDTDEIPEEALLQAQWYLALYAGQVEQWDIAALVGQEFRTYRVRPHAELQAMLIQLAGEFWTVYVQPQVPPPVDHTDAAREMLQKVYPRELSGIRLAGAAEEMLALEYRDVLARIASLETDRDLLGNQLREAIGDDAGLEGDFGRITWKRTKDGERTDWQGVARSLFNEWAFRAPDAVPAGVWEDVVSRYTAAIPGVRRFLPKFAKEDQTS